MFVRTAIGAFGGAVVAALLTAWGVWWNGAFIRL